MGCWAINDEETQDKSGNAACWEAWPDWPDYIPARIKDILTKHDALQELKALKKDMAEIIDDGLSDGNEHPERMDLITAQVTKHQAAFNKKGVFVVHNAKFHKTSCGSSTDSMKLINEWIEFSDTDGGYKMPGDLYGSYLYTGQSRRSRMVTWKRDHMVGHSVSGAGCDDVG